MLKLPLPSSEMKQVNIVGPKNIIEMFKDLCRRNGTNMNKRTLFLMQADLEQNLTDAELDDLMRKDVRGKVLESLAPEIERLVDQVIAKVEAPNE